MRRRCAPGTWRRSHKRPASWCKRFMKRASFLWKKPVLCIRAGRFIFLRDRESAMQLGTFVIAVAALLAVTRCTSVTAQSVSATETPAATVRVDATPTHAINSFDPDSALGSSIDVLSREGIDKVYTPHIIQESLSAGLGPITYRNNSELRMAAWHWTQNGTSSDPPHHK